jgi:hypothetical protein
MRRMRRFRLADECKIQSLETNNLGHGTCEFDVFEFPA